MGGLLEKRVTAADKWVAALEAELAQEKASHVWLVSVMAQFEAIAKEAQAKPQVLNQR